ncbi:hypothetical protein [Antrihabitans cavernicola]|nr:hypothetical protein [Spelaeibacter cavernicola]
MADVVDGAACAHPGDRVADRDALIQRGEHPMSRAPSRRRLSDFT